VTTLTWWRNHGTRVLVAVLIIATIAVGIGWARHQNDDANKLNVDKFACELDASAC
jgi:hypothetical protein